MRYPHTPVLALTVASLAAAAAPSRFIGHDSQIAAAGTPALGISDYAGDLGAAVAVTVLGTQRVEAGGAFNAGDSIEVGADGKAVVLAAGAKVAVALQDAAGDGDFVTVLLTP